MTGLGNDRGRLRASYGDRDRAIEVLKSAFVQGRLVKEELDERVGQALASRTYGELAALTSDIPAAATAARPRGAARQREAVRPRARPQPRKMAVAIAVGLIAPIVVMIAIATGNEQLAEVFTMPAVFTFIAWLVATAQVLDTRHSRHVGGQRFVQPARPVPPVRPARPARRGGVVWL